MEFLGFILLLVGLVAIISAVFPLIKDIKEKQKKASSKSMTRMGIGIVAIILAFIFIPGNENEEVETAKADSPESNEEELSLEERIHLSAEDAFGEVDDIVYNQFDDFVLVKVVGPENLTNNLTKQSWYKKQLEVLEDLKEEEDIKQIDFNIVSTMVDRFGNKSDDIVMKTSFSQETREKINFDNVLFENVPNIADEYWNHPAFDE
ncbi:hypothetical protein [Alkalicoccobacillus gibsonii]|uniref:hypothetical protein n=1 Tax=Alkalicoccobacillus gibsonii TaxID=79881 RepID=UPI001932DC26|nr:hypothetical protein [Alkalicoccobacillus gibsonii]MBM0065947.1 hypothetical protein [Alkalicoccobacillus gibsonii]